MKGPRGLLVALTVVLKKLDGRLGKIEAAMANAQVKGPSTPATTNANGGGASGVSFEGLHDGPGEKIQHGGTTP